MIDQCRRIAGTMQHADDDHGFRECSVVDGIPPVKRGAQPWRQLLARRPGERKVSQRLERGFDCFHKEGSDLLGCFGGDVSPDFGEVGRRGIRDAQS
jgi:hypothetical protein